ncbi:MAG: magnesium transporter [Desulfatitalea sp.]|nr:magnesium transporter [Desulfatitalea sp.]NNJ98944.1 magnesium transporter [Desulfatitalea sp.]
MSDNIYLRFIKKLFEHDAAVATHLLESLDENEAAGILQSLPPAMAARVMKNFQVAYAAALLALCEDNFLDQVTPMLDPQLLTSILMHLPQASRERFRQHISGAAEHRIRELLVYPEGSVGRIMTSDFLTFGKTTTAKEAIGKIRSLAQKRFPLSYVYVVDEEKRLFGVLNMRDLMIASPQALLDTIVRKDVFTLHSFTDIHEAAGELAKRKYFAAPVVDSENHMLGIIKAERMIKGVQEDATKDMQTMFGAGGDEKVFSSIWFSLKKRLPWLHVNLATAFLAAAVVALFEGIIAKLTILAVFLPVVAGQGGNAGAQSLAVVMRGIVMREIPENKRLSLVVKESKLGAINGLVTGLVTAMVAWAWKGNPYLGIVIGLGMLLNLIFAGLAGSSIPLVMKKLGIDPAQSSSIILTTVTDVMGFLAFLGFAVLFQNRLLQ